MATSFPDDRTDWVLALAANADRALASLLPEHMGQALQTYAATQKTQQQKIEELDAKATALQTTLAVKRTLLQAEESTLEVHRTARAQRLAHRKQALHSAVATLATKTRELNNLSDFIKKRTSQAFEAATLLKRPIGHPRIPQEELRTLHFPTLQN